MILFPDHRRDMADALCIAHLFDEAVLQSKKTLQMDPNFAIGHHELGQAFEQKHMHDEAIAEFQKAIEISGHSGVFDSSLATFTPFREERRKQSNSQGLGGPA